MDSIVKIYPNGFVANKGVTFSVNEGEIHALLGENGAGKTTLLHLLLGLYRPDSGQVMIFDSGYDTQEKQIHDSVGVVLNEDLMENHWSGVMMGFRSILMHLPIMENIYGMS